MVKKMNHKNRAKAKVAFCLIFFIAAGAAVFFCLQKTDDTAEMLSMQDLQMSVWEQILNEEDVLPAEQIQNEEKQQLSQSPEDRQVILSMGQSSDTLFISWKGSSRSPEYLRYGTDQDDLPTKKSLQAKTAKALKGKYFRYTVKLKNLKTEKKYYYEIGDGVNFDQPRSFEAPNEKSRAKFLYLGDVQFNASLNDYDRWGKMIGHIYRQNSGLDFAVIGGDMVNVPTDQSQWESFLSNCDIFSRMPLMTVPGNHEGVHSNITYKKMFAMPQNGPPGLKGEFYYFDYSCCRFIMMDSSFLTEARKANLGTKKWQQHERSIEAWLKNVLQKNKKTWTIVVIHHPPYGMHDRHTVSPEIRKLWTPIMEEAEVDMVLSGHQHMYMRTGRKNGILYVMGNSGTKTSEYYSGYNAPLYIRKLYGDGPNYQIIKATSSKLQLMSYNEKGLVIDETSLKKGLGFQIVKFFGGG